MDADEEVDERLVGVPVGDKLPEAGNVEQLVSLGDEELENDVDDELRADEEPEAVVKL